jgi:putative transposase
LIQTLLLTLLLCKINSISFNIFGLQKACFYHRRKMVNAIVAEEAKPQHCSVYSQRKPAWVTAEVLRLKALMSKAGCRAVAHTFNRLHPNTSIGKTFVAETIKRNQYQLSCIKRDMRNQMPRTVSINAVWGLDLSFKTDQQDKLNTILGIIDHGSRLAISLTTVINKRSWTVLGHLCLAIGKYGKPQAIRTDNENIFNSFVFRTLLILTGIKHQQTQLCAPWQNGRIERLFGTLKPLLKQLVLPNSTALEMALREFKLFYNHIRPHQNLNGLTPAEVWQGMTMADLKRKSKPVLVQALDGLLVGYYLRRR